MSKKHNFKDCEKHLWAAYLLFQNFRRWKHISAAQFFARSWMFHKLKTFIKKHKDRFTLRQQLISKNSLQ